MNTEFTIIISVAVIYLFQYFFFLQHLQNKTARRNIAPQVEKQMPDPEHLAASINGFVTARSVALFSDYATLQRCLLALQGASIGRFDILLVRKLANQSILICAQEHTQEYVYNNRKGMIEIIQEKTEKFYNFIFYPDVPTPFYIINGDLDVSRYDEQIQKELAELIFDRLAR